MRDFIERNQKNAWYGAAFLIYLAVILYCITCPPASALAVSANTTCEYIDWQIEADGPVYVRIDGELVAENESLTRYIQQVDEGDRHHCIVYEYDDPDTTVSQVVDVPYRTVPLFVWGIWVVALGLMCLGFVEPTFSAIAILPAFYAFLLSRGYTTESPLIWLFGLTIVACLVVFGYQRQAKGG